MKILLPVDGSPNARRAVTEVLKLIALLKQEPQILLLNVQRNLASGNVKLFISKETIAEHYKELGNAALDDARQVLDAAGRPYQYHVSVGTPSTAIVQYAQDQRVDLIVMGRRGQSGLQTALLGSVVDTVLRLAEIPVLLVK
jgi:nucleotide-binding universal stress UspA family protein